MHFLIRHGIACAASLPVLAVLPFVAIRMSWGMSGFFGNVGGIGSCCGPAQGLQEGDPQVFMNPLQPGLLLALAIVVFGATVAELASARHPRAAWAVPLSSAVIPGVLVAAGSWAGLPTDLPASVPAVLGLTATACLLLLVGYYEAVFWAVQSWRAVRARQG